MRASWADSRDYMLNRDTDTFEKILRGEMDSGDGTAHAVRLGLDHVDVAISTIKCHMLEGPPLHVVKERDHHRPQGQGAHDH